jgi:hypothetical protein
MHILLSFVNRMILSILRFVKSEIQLILVLFLTKGEVTTFRRYPSTPRLLNSLNLLIFHLSQRLQTPVYQFFIFVAT